MRLRRRARESMDWASRWSPTRCSRKGGSGFALGLTTSDCRKTYETLKARGVEFSEEPTEHPYGIDCGLRDPFGNNIRIVELATAPNQASPLASAMTWAFDSIGTAAKSKLASVLVGSSCDSAR